MNLPAPTTHSEATLTALHELYGCASTQAVEAFIESAFALTKTLIHFDSGWWGHGTIGNPPIVRGAYLHNTPESLLKDYQENVGADDVLGQAMMTSLGKVVIMRDIFTDEDFYRSVVWRNYGNRHEIHHSMGICLPGPITELADYLTVWRRDRRWPFSESDRQAQQTWFPHLVQARRINRLISINQGKKISSDGAAWAISDGSGALREVTTEFVAILNEQWPRWASGILPGEITSAIRNGKPYRSSKLKVTGSPRDDLYLLRARAVQPVDTLSNRELEIARLYSNGQTSQQIAEAIQVTPNTVRTHLRRAYQKLDVQNKVQLLDKLKALY